MAKLGRWTILALALAALAGCSGRGEVVPAATVPAEETAANAALASPTPAALNPARNAATATLSVAPTVASDPATPSATASALPASPTPVATATAAITPTLSAGDGLPCPEPPPQKPDYASYRVSAEPWPTPDPTVGPHFWLSRPVAGEGPLTLNQSFPYGSDGNGRYLIHNGLDSTEPMGTPVVAAAPGTVVVAGGDHDAMFGWRCDWYGTLVVVELDERWLGEPVYTLYGHVLNPVVEEGQRVVTGDQLAEIGFGGVATAPHLHFEVRVGTNEFGSTRNPGLWLRPVDPYGVVAGRLVDPDGRAWEGVGVTLISLDGQARYINTVTYQDDPRHLIRPDAGLAENFVFTQLEAGSYDLFVKLQDVEYRQRLEVRPGELSTVEVVTQPFQTPTPAAAPATTAAP